jgi:D-mannonate dehydratase
VLGEDNQADQARAMQQQMPGGPGGQIQDEQKAFKAEWEAMKIADYRNAHENIEKFIIET